MLRSVVLVALGLVVLPQQYVDAYRRLPASNLIVAYATACNATTLEREVRAGVNVLIWFSISLKSSDDGEPIISGGPDRACVADVRNRLDAAGFDDVAHLISVGGWDAPHPNATVADGDEWWRVFSTWDTNPRVYDGVDWDLEGNDDPSSPYNVLAAQTLNLMQTMSRAAKKAGALVSLVPPQSYLDTTAHSYDESLTHAYADWKPDFAYRGKNAYAPLLLGDENASLYDFVDVQFYESWSRCAQAVEQPPIFRDPATYLAEWARTVANGWSVDFTGSQYGGVRDVRVDPSRLVLGFSRGTPAPAGDDAGKMVYVAPADVGRAFDLLDPSLKPRGVMFWNTQLDRGPCWYPNGTMVTCDFAAGFNAFLHTRPRNNPTTTPDAGSSGLGTSS